MSLAAYIAKTWTDYADSPDLSAANVQYIDTGVAAVTAEVLALEAALPSTYQPISAELSALAGLSSTGYAKRTGAGSWGIVTSIPQSDVASASGWITSALAGKEASLGAPATNGFVLASTAAGVRSWVTLPSVPAASSTAPLMDGTAAVGTGTTWARADHVHPTDTSRLAATAQAADSAKLGGQLPSYYALASAIPAASSTIPAALGTAAVGTGTTWARADHVHAMPTAAQVGAEAALGNPGTSGYLLSSTSAGVRSWVAPYVLPVASAGTLGGVMVGTGLSIASSVLSVAYGTSAGTAAQGNDSRILNGQTAFSWGNHSTAGYALEATIGYTGTGAVDPNTLTGMQSGFTQNTAANRPGNYAFVQTLARYNGGSMQIAADSYSSDTQNLWWRRKGDNGTWYPWKTIWHSGNLIGTRNEHDHAGVYQPLDSDLTAIAALTTTVFGRSLLSVADAAAARTAIGAQAAGNYVTLDADQTITGVKTFSGSNRASVVVSNSASESGWHSIELSRGYGATAVSRRMTYGCHFPDKGIMVRVEATQAYANDLTWKLLTGGGSRSSDGWTSETLMLSVNGGAGITAHVGISGTSASFSGNVTGANLAIANWNTAYTHSQTPGNPHGTTAAQVGAEPVLGSGTAGYLLSTNGTTRSWVAPYAHPATHAQSVVDSASGWITTALAGKQAAGSYQPLENQRLSTFNSPTFLTVTAEYAKIGAFDNAGVFARVTHFTSSSFALMQRNDGATIINAAVGSFVGIRVNNIGVNTYTDIASFSPAIINLATNAEVKGSLSTTGDITTLNILSGRGLRLTPTETTIAGSSQINLPGQAYFEFNGPSGSECNGVLSSIAQSGSIIVIKGRNTGSPRLTGILDAVNAIFAIDGSVLAASGVVIQIIGIRKFVKTSSGPWQEF